MLVSSRTDMGSILEYTLGEGGAPHAFWSLLDRHFKGILTNFALRAKFAQVSTRSDSAFSHLTPGGYFGVRFDHFWTNFSSIVAQRNFRAELNLRPCFGGLPYVKWFADVNFLTKKFSATVGIC